MMSISIHTSAREVTYALLSQSQHLPISIHTSAREVTFALRDTFGYDIPISIHTSAREVTVHMDKNNAKTRKFQSTLPQGK